MAGRPRFTAFGASTAAGFFAAAFGASTTFAAGAFVAGTFFAGAFVAGIFFTAIFFAASFFSGAFLTAALSTGFFAAGRGADSAAIVSSRISRYLFMMSTSACPFCVSFFNDAIAFLSTGILHITNDNA
ncbi:MAG: hypothetical protein CVV53_04555 [Spirochaetae bacterium HGW-Spirochaetae-9]|nr:MAG: hypothetical protein CVV53_04555 [Spirochaetae bacterium HGW-Spirochaetae-9]